MHRISKNAFKKSYIRTVYGSIKYLLKQNYLSSKNFSSYNSFLKIKILIYFTKGLTTKKEATPMPEN